MLQHSRSDINDDIPDRTYSKKFQTMLRQGRAWSGGERNCFFLNTNGSENTDGKFANISAVSGIDFLDDGRAIAHIDWDSDGDLDLWISNRTAPRLRLMRNDANEGSRFLQVGLTGNGTDANRNAIGARVTLFLKENSANTPVVLNQTLYAGDGFISQGTRWLQFGLGPEADIVKIQVRWPNASQSTEEFTDLKANTRIELVQGAGQITQVDMNRGSLVLKPSVLKPAPKSDLHRIPVVFTLSVPKIFYKDFEGNRRAYDSGEGKSVLLNLWSSTCRPCLEELKEFSERYEELEREGVQILAMSIDAFDSSINEPIQASRTMAEKLKLPFGVGMADPAMVDKLRQLHNSLITLETPLPLPTSFLIDPAGNLNVIYKGPVTVDTLLTDAKRNNPDLVARLHDAAAFPGRVIDHPALMAPLSLEGSIVHLKIGRELMETNKIQEAILEYQKAIERAPHSPFAQNALGVALSATGRISKSVGYFREAVKLDPDRVQFRVNLAQSLVATNQLKEAQTILEKVVTEVERHSDAHFQLGLAKLRQQEMEGGAGQSRDSDRMQSETWTGTFHIGRVVNEKR